MKNPMPSDKEDTGAKADTTPPVLPTEVMTQEVKWKRMEPSQNCIAETIQVRGEIEGESDLTVEGRVDGPINLGTNHLTIGRTGQVNGNIQARNVTILGGIVGDVAATEKVEITDTGRLVGDIRAPRLSVSDGAHFKGRVEMAGLGQAALARPELALLTPAQQEHTDLAVLTALKKTAS